MATGTRKAGAGPRGCVSNKLLRACPWTTQSRRSHRSRAETGSRPGGTSRAYQREGSEKPASRGKHGSSDDLLDHVVGIRSRAARAVATQRAVNVSREMVREIWDLKAALQTRLPAHDAPVKQQGDSRYCLWSPHTIGTSVNSAC